MRIIALSVKNFRSFVDMQPIELGRINVFIGPNNAGKSSILRAVYAMQAGGENYADVRVGATSSLLKLELADVNGLVDWGDAGNLGTATLQVELTTTDRRSGSVGLVLQDESGGNATVGQLPPIEPRHALVPYLSRRKVAGYQRDVSEQHALRVDPGFDYLAAKLSRLGNASFDAGARYRETCASILGFVVTAVPAENGQRPAVYLPDRNSIPLEQMGEGVANIVGLLADLALSEGKVFLIEEPENDLHPHALKAMLGLIEESAERNQMLVSTHSNIVARHLGAGQDSRLFHVRAEPETLPPVAQVDAVEPTARARLAALRELGYSFSDFDLWDGWLILEESSAERIIRDYLIPWFAPRLTRIRTLSAGGNAQVEPTFEDFHRLVRFTHLEEAYRDAAWVRLDRDPEGIAIARTLQERYSGWSPDRFSTFSEPQFERYYPAEFKDRVEEALAVRDKRGRREAKRALLDEVRAWLDDDEARARAALGASARPVIDDLVQIQNQLLD